MLTPKTIAMNAANATHWTLYRRTANRRNQPRTIPMRMRPSWLMSIAFPRRMGEIPRIPDKGVGAVLTRNNDAAPGGARRKTQLPALLIPREGAPCLLQTSVHRVAPRTWRRICFAQTAGPGWAPRPAPPRPTPCPRKRFRPAILGPRLRASRPPAVSTRPSRPSTAGNGLDHPDRNARCLGEQLPELLRSLLRPRPGERTHRGPSRSCDPWHARIRLGDLSCVSRRVHELEHRYARPSLGRDVRGDGNPQQRRGGGDDGVCGSPVSGRIRARGTIPPSRFRAFLEHPRRELPGHAADLRPHHPAPAPGGIRGFPGGGIDGPKLGHCSFVRWSGCIRRRRARRALPFNHVEPQRSRYHDGA